MLKTLYSSFMATVLFAVLLCGAYPLLIWGIAQVFFHDAANGSLVSRDGKIVGSRLIGQAFSKPEYFHGRPSAAGNGYDAANSSGSNLGPTNQKFVDTLSGNVATFLKENPTVQSGHVPTDAVTASASGLDPHITPENAAAQVARVAQVRGLTRELVLTLVNQATEGPQWGIFGESVVNVLALNLELDRRYPVKKL
jgi:K+-transporting ATPase ATPase C chain